jgi:hypothetical protein
MVHCVLNYFFEHLLHLFFVFRLLYLFQLRLNIDTDNILLISGVGSYYYNIII